MQKAISQKAIDEFRAIYKKEFGIELSSKEAEEKGLNFLRLFFSIYKPIKRSELKL